MTRKRKLQERHQRRTWLISDTHFHHENIIHYANRPFTDVDEMDRMLTDNWNGTIRNGDLVYFLGDLSFKQPGIMNILNGRKIMVKGNHDTGLPYKMHRYLKVKHKDIQFLLMHDPGEFGRIRSLEGFKGWLIHGHTHNNHPEEYPFINYDNCTINVCVEMTGYAPVAFDTLATIIKEQGNPAGIGYEERLERMPVIEVVE